MTVINELHQNQKWVYSVGYNLQFRFVGMGRTGSTYSPRKFWTCNGLEVQFLRLRHSKDLYRVPGPPIHEDWGTGDWWSFELPHPCWFATSCCWHDILSCASVQEPFTITQFRISSQQNIAADQNCHHVCEFTQPTPLFRGLWSGLKIRGFFLVGRFLV